MLDVEPVVENDAVGLALSGDEHLLFGALRCSRGARAVLCGADRCLLFFWQGYGSSKLHAVDLHRYCVAHVSELQAIHDNVKVDEALLHVVAMAAGGAEPSHIERDLQRYLDRHLPLKYPISTIPLRIKKPRWEEAHTIQHPIIWPFDAAHAVASFSGELFKTLLGGSEQARFDWWSTQRNAAWVRRHPAFAGLSVEDSKNFIPFWLHGDDVAYSKHSKMCVISWGNRVGVESNIFSNRWPFIVLPYGWIIKDVTLNMVWHAFSLACKQFLTGLMPDRPLMGPAHKLLSWQSLVAGQEIAYGLKFAFSDMKCDMQFQMQTFDFRSYNANDCCKDCFASKVDPELNYMEVGFDAGWRSTFQSHEDWIFTRAYRSAALDVPGMCKERVVDDWMHNGHLGIYPHVLGSVLDDMAGELFLGNGPSHVKWTRAWNESNAWCSLNDPNCSMPPFTHVENQSHECSYLHVVARSHLCSAISRTWRHNLPTPKGHDVVPLGVVPAAHGFATRVLVRGNCWSHVHPWLRIPLPLLCYCGSEQSC